MEETLVEDFRKIGKSYGIDNFDRDESTLCIDDIKQFKKEIRDVSMKIQAYTRFMRKK